MGGALGCVCGGRPQSQYRKHEQAVADSGVQRPITIERTTEAAGVKMNDLDRPEVRELGPDGGGSKSCIGFLRLPLLQIFVITR